MFYKKMMKKENNKMADFYSCAMNLAFNSDENDQMELEVTYNDSDGIETGAYAEGTDFVQLVGDICDQLQENIANISDEKADLDEKDALYARIQELEKENHQLKEQIEDNTHNDKDNIESKYDKVALRDSEKYLNSIFEERYSNLLNNLKKNFDKDSYANILKTFL